jgi:hypothetical protein
MAITTILNCRVAGAPNYYPAYIPQNGNKPVRQRCEVAVYENDGDKTNTFRVTAFGKMADIVARSCGTGKQLGLALKTHTFDGKVALPGGQPGTPPNFVIGQDGQPITIKKTGHIIMDISFGADSEKQEVSEIKGGFRPAMWNVKGHPDHQTWKDICAQRNSIEYQPGMTSFGYANVLKPNGQVISSQQLQGMNQQYAGNPQAVGNGFAGMNQQNGYGPAQRPVQQTPPQQNSWGQQPSANPVFLHGQNVGFAPNNATPANQQGGYNPGPAPAQSPQQGGYNQTMGYAPNTQGGAGTAVTM